MKEIYCFAEELTTELEEWIAERDDAEHEIHLYTQIAESCEYNLFYCMGEVTNLFVNAEDKGVFVTNVPQIYACVQQLYHSYYDEVRLFGQDNVGLFQNDIDYEGLLSFEMSVLLDEVQQVVFWKIFQLRDSDDRMAMYDVIQELERVLEIADWKQKAIWVHLLESVRAMQKGQYRSAWYEVMLCSILMKLNANVEYTNRLLQLMMSSPSFGKENWYFVWHQFKNISLKHLAVCDEETRAMLDTLYAQTYEAYYEQEKESLSGYKIDSLDPNVVIVCTIQFLDGTHAPTRTVMERCKSLRKMGKEVYLVNTTEQYITKGVIPFYAATGGSFMNEYDGLGTVEIGDEQYPMLQLPVGLKLEERMFLFQELIRKVRPGYILSVGTGSMIADLVGNMVPCVSMALAFSTLPHTMNRLQILGRDIREEDSFDEDKHIIPSRFTFELKPKSHHYTREQWGIPENAFVLVVVGIRLDFEIDECFMKMLEQVLTERTCVVFAGIWNEYDACCEQYPWLKEHSLFVGYCEDVNAFMELCDLYVNPARLGGGFSVIEAFANAKPGVYLPVGDVAVAGGEEFEEADYREMAEQIKRYQTDRVYYARMSERARKRAELMTDSVTAMRELDERIQDAIRAGKWKHN